MFSLSVMGRTRRPKVPSQLRKVIARNVLLRADALYGEKPNIPEAIVEASHPSKRERLARSLVQNIMAGKTGTSVDNLEKLARALELLPYQLLIPSLDAHNPQVAKGALPGEEKAYGPELKEAVREATKEALAEALANGQPKHRKRS